jgi:hypothetical protein
LRAAHDNRPVSFVEAKGAGSIARYPTELTTLARTPSRTVLRGLPGLHKLASDRAKRIAVDAQLGAGAIVPALPPAYAVLWFTLAMPR